MAGVGAGPIAGVFCASTKLKKPARMNVITAYENNFFTLLIVYPFYPKNPSVSL